LRPSLIEILFGWRTLQMQAYQPNPFGDVKGHIYTGHPRGNSAVLEKNVKRSLKWRTDFCAPTIARNMLARSTTATFARSINCFNIVYTVKNLI
jgi:hypothetical protein